MIIFKTKILILLLNIASCTNSVTVSTNYGMVSGISNPSQSVEIFRGIPFAKPPIGSLRWERPVPVEPWETTLNASSFGSVCPQPAVIPGNPMLNAPFMGDEDCLYLNIYRPAGDISGLLPVMLWIHGGGYVMGSADMYDGGWLAERGVIVVTINYRLGFLGFASTADDKLPGNYGLLDQHESIAFTKKIIQSFGGDPQKITIFGESAGGGSVLMQVLSPLSKGLVQRGISQSGAYGWTKDSVYLEKICSLVSGCSSANLATSITFLKEAPISDIIPSLSETIETIYFLPTPHDGFFFPNDVRETIASGNLDCTDFIGGWNDLDGNIMTLSGFSNITSPSDLDAFVDLIGDWLGLEMNQAQTEALFEYYSILTPPETRWERLISDVMFMKPTLEVADALVRSGCQNIYAYTFSFDGTHAFPTSGPGAGHGDELQYMFNFGDIMRSLGVEVEVWGKEEEEVSQFFLSSWSQFAKNGVVQNWPEYGSERKIYLISNTAEVSIDHHSRIFFSKLAELTSSSTSQIPTTQLSNNMHKTMGTCIPVLQTDPHLSKMHTFTG